MTMSSPRQAFLAIAVLLIGIPWLADRVLPIIFMSAGSFDFGGALVTPDVIDRYCPAYLRMEGVRIRHIKNIDGMTGGQMTVQFELPAHKLPGWIENSPLKGALLESKFVPVDFDTPTWLTKQRHDELQESKLFSAASIRNGRTYYTILIDRAQPDVFVIYLQSVR
jgi:hypothetical protein